ncbi:hypothetical protein ABBQ38_002551 [Trebouxia sp. C0009 RCD-2024]
MSLVGSELRRQAADASHKYTAAGAAGSQLNDVVTTPATTCLQQQEHAQQQKHSHRQLPAVSC